MHCICFYYDIEKHESETEKQKMWYNGGKTPCR